MKFFTPFLLLLTFSVFAANYVVTPGKMHEKGKVEVTILPHSEMYKVRMSYDLDAKVPIPKKLLQGKKIMDFPLEFRTEAGYKNLETQKRINIPKAQLRFVKRADFGKLKNAYYVEVLPTNKKSRINLIYHPSVPDTGWQQVTIYLLNLPLMDEYEVVAKLK